MVANVLSATTVGFDGQIIEVECDATKGLPSFQIVGLGNKAIDEAKERVRSAIKNSHLDFPAKRITINLAPANIPKNGAHFDLPIALAVLIVGGQLPHTTTKDKVFAGELSLDGTLRSIKGAIHITETARQAGAKQVFLPVQNAEHAALVEDIEVIGVQSLSELFLFLTGEKKPRIATIPPDSEQKQSDITFDDVYGQEQSKRALTIAATGHHNILLTGPPGTGKTMLAKALMSILPPLSAIEQIEVLKLQSLVGDLSSTSKQRPFRAPHHTASHVSLVGGGTHPIPGEMSLAHHGVLFLDEIPEYPRASLEAMRQPLEDQQISISRANQKVTFPANFMLVATQNPCPCGYLGDLKRECSCTGSQIQQYQKKLSGPLLDRIDLIVPVGRITHNALLHPKVSTGQTRALHRKITRARSAQAKRYEGTTATNGSIGSKQIKQFIPLDKEVASLLFQAAQQLNLSTRAYFKIIKVARSIADLEESPDIHPSHITEALQYRLHS